MLIRTLEVLFQKKIDELQSTLLTRIERLEEQVTHVLAEQITHQQRELSSYRSRIIELQTEIEALAQMQVPPGKDTTSPLSAESRDYRLCVNEGRIDKCVQVVLKNLAQQLDCTITEGIDSMVTAECSDKKGQPMFYSVFDTTGRLQEEVDAEKLSKFISTASAGKTAIPRCMMSLSY